MKSTLIIGTRGSDLALWQANHVKDLLGKIGLQCELKIIKTQGDQIQHLSLDKLEGKGFFTKEIEEALLNHETDIAVHSHKDLPTESPAQLVIAAVSDREDPSELLLINKEAVDGKQKFSLKKNAVLGTSSARRKAQFLAFRDDIQLKDLRGNVPTRINKLKEKQYDAILVAAAGVERLNIDLSSFHVEKMDPKEFVPAPAQGVLAIQIRESDKELFAKLQQINNPAVAKQIFIERKVLNLFQGGCQMPVGVYTEYDEEEATYKVWASKAAEWNKAPISIYMESKHPESLPEKIVSKINSIKPGSVFISRNPKGEDYFTKVLSAIGYTVSGRSLIEMKPVAFKEVPKTDWIFFSSKHAVNFFFHQKPKLEQQKFACVGKATASMLRKYNVRADFIGYSTDTKLTGKQFASRVGDGKVLFPQAKGSLRSIQNGFVKKEQVIDLVVYETLKRNEEVVPHADVVVFTSPSNVESFFEKNKITADQKVVAMGDATASTLRNFGVSRAAMPQSFDDLGLVRAVFSL